jgi:hypothetical protein
LSTSACTSAELLVRLASASAGNEPRHTLEVLESCVKHVQAPASIVRSNVNVTVFCDTMAVIIVGGAGPEGTTVTVKSPIDNPSATQTKLRTTDLHPKRIEALAGSCGRRGSMEQFGGSL